MRVLLSERNLDGHRKTYMKWLVTADEGAEYFCLTPENIGMDAEHYIPLETVGKDRSFRAYLHWIARMRAAVREKQIDVLHILDGDSIMRYFGIGFATLGVKRIIITYHHFFPGLARKISYRMMCRGKTRTCVAHTESVRHSLLALGIKRVELCVYPAFNFDRIASLDPLQCRQRLGIPKDVPTIGVVGGMSAYKNIVPFLETMQNCQADFRLLICGKESDVSAEVIQRATASYADKVTLILRHMSDEEYQQAIVASDIIFCIYSHVFDGASGPLTDGVCARKMILSCRHGSLGQIVTRNHLGVTAECEDRVEILTQAEYAISQARHFQYDEVANRYRACLMPSTFQNTYRGIYGGE